MTVSHCISICKCWNKYCAIVPDTPHSTAPDKTSAIPFARSVCASVASCCTTFSNLFPIFLFCLAVLWKWRSASVPVARKMLSMLFDFFTRRIFQGPMPRQALLLFYCLPEFFRHHDHDNFPCYDHFIFRKYFCVDPVLFRMNLGNGSYCLKRHTKRGRVFIFHF